jgi:4-amino-4-deoxy-L-arabinose transferase-like glycosyltransferase
LPSGARLSLLIFLALAAAVWLSHLPLLRLPYYWDELGYYIPAAWDFYSTGTLIPHSTLTNAHPPLPSILLAGCWKLFGYSPFVTRSAVCLVAAAALTAVYRLALALTRSVSQAIAATLLTAVYPVWFAQSTLAHADIFAAAATLWALVFYFEDEGKRQLLAILCFALAALAKETAIGIPLTLALWELAACPSARQSPHRSTRNSTTRAALLALPCVPLALWFLYHRHVTGSIFGNPEFLRYNAGATLVPLRVVAALGNRMLQLFAHMDLFALTLPAIACLLLPPLPGREPIAAADRRRLILLLGVGLVFFSVLGGALLNRYLLPLYPLVVVLSVNTLFTRLKHWCGVIAFAAAAFVLALFVNPPYQFAPEDNLDYADVIELHQSAIAEVERRYSRPTILTAWPVADELTRPELGYLQKPYQVVPIDKAASSNEPYTVAIVFSTKYTPARVLIPLGRAYRRLDERYFAAHTDLGPDEIARLLHGTVVWREARGGQWAAVLHFDRPQLARLDPGRR